jgi:AmmeMemoRadiSam system protein A
MIDNFDKATLLKLARVTLETYLKDGIAPAFETSRSSLLEQKGAFVSLHQGEELRGCIGQLYPDRELYSIVQHCAISAALEDTRFAPVSLEEVPALSIEISVLTPFRRVHDVEEIIVGTHGLYIVQGSFRGLLLPQVAVQYEWDRKTFLEHTCRKAGLPDSAWKDSRTQVYAFEAEVFSDSLPSDD